MRKALAMLGILGTLACGGGATAPSYAYPDVAGAYVVTGTLDQNGGAEYFTGNLGLDQPDRNSGALSGGIGLTLPGPTPTTPAIFAARLPSETTLSSAGVIDFTFLDANGNGNGAAWAFHGRWDGRKFTGRHVFTLNGDSLTGAWTATRQ
jgi:hypothetical protein